MAVVRPLTGIHYAASKNLSFSNVIAPPYDVLNESQKAALEQRDPHNIVRVDLPHMPPKTAGPDAVYQAADATLKSWLADGVLERDARAGFYPYTQSYEHGTRTYHRRGFIALVKLSAFGAGDVVPHEKTYKGPIEDRLKLMRATGAQLSPIFGLYSDPRNQITQALYAQASKPFLSGTMDGVRNDLWVATDAQTINHVTDLMHARPIYIADGHHRYTTALQYKLEMEQANGGPLAPNHPANWCMFVLVGMQDEGLLILPTHRLIGGLSGWSIDAFTRAVSSQFEVTATDVQADDPAELARAASRLEPHTFGLYDGATRKLYRLRLKNLDVLAKLEPNQSTAWRQLDVAILQRYLLDEVLGPQFAKNSELTRGYTADAATIPPQVDGKAYQLALILRPTPLHALEDLGKHGEVMPQKSTYFFPKLATGMVINPLR